MSVPINGEIGLQIVLWCAIYVFFRDGKFLLEAVGIFSWFKSSWSTGLVTQNTKVTNSKNQKKKNPHVFFLSSCNEIFLACQICKNFDGKLGFSSSMHMFLRASHDQCTNKRRTVFWVEGAFETKANGEWTSIVLLLLSQQLPEYFVEMDTNKMERK